MTSERYFKYIVAIYLVGKDTFSKSLPLFLPSELVPDMIEIVFANV